jgi:hypothetical protein
MTNDKGKDLDYRIIFSEDVLSWNNFFKNNGSYNNENFIVFMDLSDLLQQLPIQTEDQTNPFPPKKLENFFKPDTDIGLLLTRGLKPSGGYNMEVKNIKLKHSTVIIKLNIEDPKGIVDDSQHLIISFVTFSKKALPKGSIKFVFKDQNGIILK